MKKTLKDYKEIIKTLPMKNKYTKEEILAKDFLIDKDYNIDIYYAPHNENFNNETTIIFDEQPEDTFKAIYICGVISKGFSAKKNYPHNVHLAIIPKKGARCLYQFEEWIIEIEDGMISMIPEIEELPEKYQDLPEQ